MGEIGQYHVFNAKLADEYRSDRFELIISVPENNPYNNDNSDVLWQAVT